MLRVRTKGGIGAVHILVTGAAGFVGSHLCDRLVALGHSVVGLDNLSTGNLENISHLLGHERFRFVHGSILDGAQLVKAAEGVDRIYHLAAAVGVQYVMSRPVKALITNTRGTENVLEVAARKKIRTLITSSSEVYGKTGGAGLHEQADRTYGSTDIKRWGYACSKALDEFLALAYHEEFGLPVVIVRLFNTVGPRQTGRYGMVIPRFVRQALRGEPITVYGDGTQTRSFTYVGDVVRAMTGLLECDEALGQVVNIGNGKSISMLELAKKVKAKTGSVSEIRLVPYEEAYGPGYEDMQERTPDISKIRQLIGYEPTLDLDEILDLVIEYERNGATASVREAAG